MFTLFLYLRFCIICIWDSNVLEKECENIIQNECTDELACNYLNPFFLNDPTCLYPNDECVTSILEGGELTYGIYDENCMWILG